MQKEVSVIGIDLAPLLKIVETYEGVCCIMIVPAGLALTRAVSGPGPLVEALFCLLKPSRLEGASTETGAAAGGCSSSFTGAVSGAGPGLWLDGPSSSLWLLLAVQSAGCHTLDSGSFHTCTVTRHDYKKGARKCN